MRNIILILLVFNILIFPLGCSYINPSEASTKTSITSITNNNKAIKRAEQFFLKIPSLNVNLENEIIYNDVKIPVLLYHSVSDNNKDENTGTVNEAIITVNNFKDHMNYLKEEGYYTLSLEEYMDFMENNKPIPKKSILITLDDGYKDNYINVYPIMMEIGLKCTIFVIVDEIDTHPLYLTSKEIVEMSKSNITFGSHTKMHGDLGQLNYNLQLTDLVESKEKLESILGNDVKSIAYPFGHYNDSTFRAAKDAGYRSGFLVDNLISTKDQGMYGFKRITILASDSVDKFSSKIGEVNN